MKSQIPNIITCCNLISGCIATVFALYFQPEMALLFIIIGAAFDFCDGLSARALNVSSPIGKELDSLADVITFGVAPSAIIFHELSVLEYPGMLSSVKEYIPFVAFVLAAFSALRLAKFNLDTRQTTSFIGLPTPANAMFWGSLIVGYKSYIENIPHAFMWIILLVFVSSYLLICELPMFALKFKHWGINEKGNIVKYGFIVLCAAVFFSSLVFGKVVSSFAIMILAYILVSVIMWCTSKH